MVTKIADKIGIKKKKCHLRPNLRLLETDVLRIRYQHKQIPKNPFNILCASYFSSSVEIFFWYLLVLYINSSVTCLKLAKKWSFSYFQPVLAAIFVTIATVKVRSIQELYTPAIVLILL